MKATSEAGAFDVVGGVEEDASDQAWPDEPDRARRTRGDASPLTSANGLRVWSRAAIAPPTSRQCVRLATHRRWCCPQRLPARWRTQPTPCLPSSMMVSIAQPTAGTPTLGTPLAEPTRLHRIRPHSVLPGRLSALGVVRGHPRLKARCPVQRTVLGSQLAPQMITPTRSPTAGT